MTKGDAGKLSSMKGQKGATGPRGPAGPKGADGEKGNTGPIGKGARLMFACACAFFLAFVIVLFLAMDNYVVIQI